MARPRVHDDHLRQTLLEAATDHVAEHGADFSLRPLVASVGTSTSAVYSLFGSRGGLVDAVTVRAASSLIEAQRAVEADSVTRRTESIARTIRAWASAHPTMFQVVFGGASGSAAVDEAREATLAPLIEAIEAADDEGALAGGDPVVAARSVFAAVHGFVALELLGVFAEEDADELFEAQLLALWRGWSADAATASAEAG